MARIAGVDLPREKRIEIGLTYIFGIGLPTSKKILAATGVDPNTRVKNLTDESAAIRIISFLTVPFIVRRTGPPPGPHPAL